MPGLLRGGQVYAVSSCCAASQASGRQIRSRWSRAAPKRAVCPLWPDLGALSSNRSTATSSQLSDVVSWPLRKALRAGLAGVPPGRQCSTFAPSPEGPRAASRVSHSPALPCRDLGLRSGIGGLPVARRRCAAVTRPRRCCAAAAGARSSSTGHRVDAESGISAPQYAVLAYPFSECHDSISALECSSPARAELEQSSAAVTFGPHLCRSTAASSNALSRLSRG